MKNKARKTTTNVALKVAIVQSGKRQRQISIVSRIPEQRLSGIVTGRVEPTDTEKAALARALKKSIDELFPALTTEVVA